MLNLTLKNIPEDLHAHLKESAEKNRRSLNSEILVRLESEFTAPIVDTEAQARALKTFTAKLPRVEHAKVGRRWDKWEIKINGVDKDKWGDKWGRTRLSMAYQVKRVAYVQRHQLIQAFADTPPYTTYRSPSGTQI